MPCGDSAGDRESISIEMAVNFLCKACRFLSKKQMQEITYEEFDTRSLYEWYEDHVSSDIINKKNCYEDVKDYEIALHEMKRMDNEG